MAATISRVVWILAFLCIASCGASGIYNSFIQNKFLSSSDGYQYTRLHTGTDKIQKLQGREENDQHSVRILPWQKSVAEHNLAFYDKKPSIKGRSKRLNDGRIITYNPGDQASSFSIWTVEGQKLVYPSSPMFRNSSVVVHVLDPGSGFLQCMWTSSESIKPLIQHLNSSNNTQFIFIPKYAGVEEEYGAKWMKARLYNNIRESSNQLSSRLRSRLMNNVHFSVEPLYKLGSWIPEALQQWQCVDHLCGLDQVVIQSNASPYPVVTKRLDARYDWLPSPQSVFTNKTIPLIKAGNGCLAAQSVKHSIALLESGGCSFYQKVRMMQTSGAVGVVVYTSKNKPLQDMNCNNSECQSPLSIPATMVEYMDLFNSDSRMNTSFQNTPSENFFMAIDNFGKLAEVGWFLYPTMHFLVWQAQWFDYSAALAQHKQTTGLNVKIFEQQIMQGKKGVVVNITLPDKTVLQKYSLIELEMELSCPGSRDTTCPHWDHTINLYVCCDPDSPLCGMELGRWISAFRRRIGHWMSDVSPLLPLLTSKTCTFTMKTEPWAMPWVPSLNIKFSELQKKGDLYADETFVLYQPGATFDKNYNSHFKAHTFKVPSDVKKVEVFAVITGHGSDNNGCGEFCITSHHFVVNNHTNNITFSIAGSPLGCAERVLTGVEPNEHGTWLYGRNGWCDGQNVKPWVIDITSQLKTAGEDNSLRYFGWFQGADPNPKENPGIIILYSYLVYYREL